LQGAASEIRGGGLDTVVQYRVKFQGAHVGFSVSGCQTKVPGPCSRAVVHQDLMTVRFDLPSCIRSSASLIRSSGMV
jgi:hypothetical protein